MWLVDDGKGPFCNNDGPKGKQLSNATLLRSKHNVRCPQGQYLWPGACLTCSRCQ